MLFYKIINKGGNYHQGVITTIYFHFISPFSKEFVHTHTLDFFQQKNSPIFPFIEPQLQHLDSYLQSNQVSSNFGPLIENII
jgi:hypothetical protein